MVAAAVLTVAGPARTAAAAGPCDAPVVSPIACENSKPGSPQSQWGVTGSGSSAIQGFATDMSVDQGATIAFKVDTTATSYRLEVYRMGWYGGLGARRITTFQPTAVTHQPTCLNDVSTGLVDCGDWSVSATWTVPADAVSGVYFVKLVRTDGTSGSSHIPFVVRDDDGHSAMVFQTSDTTWQAYNSYGGNSLYTGAPAGRAYKVSYNRPFTTRQNTPEDFFFNAEYPMVRFLESNGYDVSYLSGVDTDRRGSELLEHRVFLSVGHDEYWSGAQRANVEAARDAGVNLAFFSGNEMFWKTRWETSIDGSGTPYRTLVTYKETHANARIDPQGPATWTGTWRDPRFSPPGDGGRPENAVTGQIFTMNCCDTTMAVGSADGKLRFWRNTRVAGLAPGTKTKVGVKTIGYEWDEDLDNGFRPAGSFRVSETKASGQKLQDYGSTYASGSGTHSMTIYRAPSGALVFGAGTVQWSWGLDDKHDRGKAAADVAAQQATVNLFADMGVQPTTLRSGLVSATASTDTIAPTSTVTSPAPGATLAFGAPVTITGKAKDTGGGRVGGVEVSTDGGATWHRATNRETWSYTFTPTAAGPLTIKARATDDSANLGTPGAGVPVTVAPAPSNCPCTVFPASATPQADIFDDPAELGMKFRSSINGYITGIRYYKPATVSGTHVGTLWTADGTKLGTATFTNESASGWQQADFGAPIAISAGTTYVGSYFSPSGYAYSPAFFTDAPVQRGPLTAPQNSAGDPNGVYRYTPIAGAFPTDTFNSNNYFVDVVFNETATDSVRPTVVDRSPADGATGVARNATVTATLSEAVTPASVSMVLRDAANQVVPSSTTYDAATNTATLTPQSLLTRLSTYTVTVSGATDPGGNTMTPTAWSFQTVAPVSDGPGGPIALVTSDANPSSAYLTEIARAEGLNEFANVLNTDVTPSVLAGYDVVVLGNVAITDAQVAALTDWVTAGGNLILLKPDPRLLGLAGLRAQAGSVSEGYLAVEGVSEAGSGITTETMQFHGTADRYELDGATSVAELYTTATTAAGAPAVTMHEVGSNGGQVATFAFDLPSSIIATRQGNIAWAGEERDGITPRRADDLFFGGSTAADWVDLDKVAIPQADEQQRLLANLVTTMVRDRLPMPRFWYFPKTYKAVLVATGDDHGNGGTAGRMDAYAAASPAGCTVQLWECARFTSYIYPNTPLSDSQAAAYTAQGFEIGLHPSSNCNDFPSLASLRATYTSQLQTWRNKYTSLPSPTTSRFHCIVWSDWASQPKAELASGIRLDTNYYYYPPTWINDRPGFMTGSGMPMRFADTDGSMIDVYQAATQMTDESGQTYPATPDALFDRALGPLGYYGAFTANLHTDSAQTSEDEQTFQSAQAHGVPIIAARQLLNWTDGRNASAFTGLAWSADTLSFSVSVGEGATGLTGMLPATGPAGRTLTAVTRDGNPVTFATMTVKGQTYATFPAAAGAYQATYGG